MAWSVLCTATCVTERWTVRTDQTKRDVLLSAKQVRFVYCAGKSSLKQCHKSSAKGFA